MWSDTQNGQQEAQVLPKLSFKESENKQKLVFKKKAKLVLKKKLELKARPNNYQVAYEKGYDHLNDFQRDILKDCLKKKTGGLSLPMGSGKTLISLVLSLKQNQETQDPILVVCAKSLIAGWQVEIRKFFGDTLKYEVLHQTTQKNKLDTWRIDDETQVILTTPEVISKYYKNNHIANFFIQQKFLAPPAFINYYREPKKPFLSHTFGGGYLFSKKWGSLIIDEAQKYTQINTIRCQSLGAICAKNRWALSGTLFDEPIPERILGYYIILDIPEVPRNLPEIKWLIYHPTFKGLNSTLVHRKENKVFQPPKVSEEIVSHRLSIEEAKVYTMMKQILVEVKRRVQAAKLVNDTENIKKFSSYLLVMITYLRQALICPLIPIASIAIDASDMEKKSELSQILVEEIEKLGIHSWLNDIDSVKSSRIKNAIRKMDAHQNERVVLFSCYKSCIDVLQSYLPPDREVLRIEASMSIKRRGEVIEEFAKTKNGILLLTYQLGAEGLNLQCASTVLLMDFWWNAAKTQQAIARVLRFGQEARVVNVYFFSSNTGIEQALFKKQHAKLMILDELKNGAIETKIPSLKMNEIIKLIELDDNKQLMRDIGYVK